MEELEFYPILKFNGRPVSMYLIDCYGISDNELNPAELGFIEAEFSDCNKPLTEFQLVRLSKQYPQVIYSLIQDWLPDDSLHHATYKPLTVTPSGEYCVF